MNKFGTTLQTSWDWRAAGNFMFGGAGSGLMFIAAVASYPHGPATPLALIALGLVGLGLSCVWLEIGRPWRFLHVFFHPQTSWMTREGSVAVMLFVLTVTGITFNVATVMEFAGIAGAVFLFCQGQMLKACKGIPAWREPTILPLIVVTGICEGTAALLLFLVLQNQIPMMLNLACLFFLATRILSWQIYRKNLAAAKVPPVTMATLGKIHSFQIIAGNVIPAMLIILSMAMPELAHPVTASASVLIVVSGWHMKFVIITRASQVQGYGLSKVQRGRPDIRPPVRRKPDRFVF